MQTKRVRYTFNRGGYYYFTRRVPSDLKQHYLCPRIVQGLNTKCFSTAKIYDAAMAILFGEDGYQNLREQDIHREHYQEANARIEWFKYRMQKKKRETG